MAKSGWVTLESAFQRAIDLNEEEKRRFLANFEVQHPELAEPLKKLLQASLGDDNELNRQTALALGAIAQHSTIPAAQEIDLSGTQIGRYQIIEVIGRGGMGVVYLGRDPSLRRPVVIKVPRTDDPDDPDRQRRLRKEAQIHGRLLHDNIVRVYDLVSQDGRDHIVSEYIDGGTLREYAKRLTPADRLSRCLQLILHVARGLLHAHSYDVVHRDLKLDNVLVTKTHVAKITDFGLSRSLGRRSRELLESIGSAEGLVGTPYSMSPEQTKGAPVDDRSDIFAFGVLCYELLSGQAPFAGANIFETIENIRKKAHRPLREAYPETPTALSELVDRTLEKERTQRPSSTEVVEVLEKIVPGAHLPDDTMVAEETRRAAVLVLRLPRDTVSADVFRFQHAVRDLSQRTESLLITGTGRSAAICFGFSRVLERPAIEGLGFIVELTQILDAEQRALDLACGLAVGDIGIRPVSPMPILAGPALEAAEDAARAARPGQAIAVGQARQPLEAAGYRLHPLPSDAAYQRFEIDALTVGPSCGELIGRDEVLQVLTSEAEKIFRADVSDVAGRVVIIEGEAGIGKSAVLREFSARKLPGAPQVLLGTSTESSRYAALGMFRPVLAALIEISLEGAWPPDVRAAVAKGAPNNLVTQAAVAQVLGVASAEQVARLEQQNADHGRDFLTREIAAFILGRAQLSPFVLILEDLHWADHASRQVIETLVAHADRVPLLVIAAHRPVLSFNWQAKNIQRITLDRLSAPDAEVLVLRLSSEKSLPPEAVSVIIQRSEGVPLWLEELTYAAAEANDSGQVDASAYQSLNAPTLDAVVQRRLHSLSTEGRRVAQVCAAIGRRIPVTLLSKAMDTSSTALDSSLVALEQRSLIHRRGLVRAQSVVFRHVLMEEAVYETIDSAARVDIHRRICSGLEEGAGPRPQDEPEVFAHHYELAGHRDSAIKYWSAAADRATRLWAHQVACRHFERALLLIADLEDEELRLQQEIETRQQYGMSLTFIKGFASREAEQNNARLFVLRGGSPTAGHWSALFHEWANAFLTGRIENMVTLQGLLQQRMEAMPEEEPERLLLDYLIMAARGLSYLHTGRLAACVDVLERARQLRDTILPILQTLPDRSVIVAPTTYAATAYAIGNNYPKTLALLADDAERFGPETPEYPQLCVVGAIACVAGRDYQRAFDQADVAVKRHDQIAPHALAWAKITHRYAHISLALEAPPENRDLTSLKDDLAELPGYLDATSATGVRTGVLFQFHMIGELADRILGDATVTSLHVVARSLFDRCFKEIEEAMDDPDLVHVHAHMHHQLHDLRARWFDLNGRLDEAKRARALAESAWNRLEKPPSAEDSQS